MRKYFIYKIKFITLNYIPNENASHLAYQQERIGGIIAILHSIVE